MTQGQRRDATVRWTSMLLISLLCFGCSTVPALSARAKAKLPGPPPLPILAPTGLTGDADDGRVYLRWNPQIEDARVIGWQVRQQAPTVATLNTKPLIDTAFVVRDLQNGVAYTFVLVGMLKGGGFTPSGNAVTVTPAPVGTAKVEQFSGKITVGSFIDAPVVDGKRVIFPDGQELIFGNFRPVDWKTRDGKHLLYPRQFGNGVDIGKFDKRGLPVVIPPDGLDKTPPFSSADGHAPFDALNPNYRDLQFGVTHPHITDPITLPLSRSNNDARPRWLGTEVDGNRVTLHYSLPIALFGYRSWTNVEVFETWWPLERDRHGAVYHGLARLVEVVMPSVVKEGYQVMLNNGFGPGGSRVGVSSYNTGFREPGAEIVDFSPDENRQVFFQGSIPARQGYGYHPNGNSLQASPLIFYNWESGCMTITARSLYYHCSNNSASYIQQGADGVWPNLAWDLAISGTRTPVDTVEYLYTSEVVQPLPQRYINAHLEALNNVSRRMGVQDTMSDAYSYANMTQIKSSGGPEAFADIWIANLQGKGVGSISMYHDTWQACPCTVDPAWLNDEKFAANPSLKAMTAKLLAAGLHSGFWFRPEFCMTSIPTMLSSPMRATEGYYHGIEWMSYPEPGETNIAKDEALLVIRNHPEWIRRQIDAAWPTGTSYQWIPMSLASGWWDEIMWPALHMSATLGYDRVLTDGGFGGMQGVDYAPMLAGNSATAVPCQPYWWRYFRTLQALGIRQFGECTGGWIGANTSVGGPDDLNHLWLYQGGSIVFAAQFLKTPEALHRAYQLYNNCWNDLPAASAVRRYASKIYQENPAPDWIELHNLRQDDPVEVKQTTGSLPGRPGRATPEQPYIYTVRPWVWDNVTWHYADGRTVGYPAYQTINWEAQE